MPGDRLADRRAIAVDEIEDALRNAGLVQDLGKRIALSGAISLGLSTDVQPAASAGASFDVTWLSGQFHGVIRPHTPIGSRRISVPPMKRSSS